MYERFTDRARKVMQLANQEAQRFNHEYIGTEHILLGLIKEGSGVAANVLKNLDIDLRKIRLEVEKIVQAGPEQVTMGKLPQTPRAKKVIEYSIEEARNLNHNYVGTEHLLLGLLREQEGVAAQVLMNLGLRLDQVREEALNLLGRSMESRDLPTERVSSNWKARTPTLDGFGCDLTELARQGKLDPVIGRQREIDRAIVVLSRRTRNNPVLVGEIGIGRTAVVKGLAQRIAAGSVPEPLRDRRLVGFDLAALVASVNDRRQLEERIRAIVNELRRAKDVILFFDDLRTLVGSPGAAGSRSASKFLKSALLRGDFQFVATATLDQFRQHLASEVTLERYWQTVTVEPSTPGDTLDILRGLRSRYEDHHRVLIADEALAAAIELSTLFLPDQFLPKKALDLLDETGALLRLQLGDRLLQEVEAIHQQIAELNLRKEERVANRDFEGAALDRDQCDKLKSKREHVRREWRSRAKEVGLVADSNSVLEALSGMTGIDVEQIRNQYIRPEAVVLKDPIV